MIWIIYTLRWFKKPLLNYSPKHSHHNHRQNETCFVFYVKFKKKIQNGNRSWQVSNRKERQRTHNRKASPVYTWDWKIGILLDLANNNVRVGECFKSTHWGDIMAMALRGRTTAVNIKLEMVMKMISTVVEFLQNQSNTPILKSWCCWTRFDWQRWCRWTQWSCHFRLGFRSLVWEVGYL